MGQLTFAGGKAAPAWGDPGIWYPAVTRTAGRVLVAKVNITALGGQFMLGWDTDTTGVAGANGYYLATVGGAMRPYDHGVSGPNVELVSATTDYYLAVALRATGAMYFIKGGAFSTWTMFWRATTNNTASLYPAISGYNAAFTVDYIRIPAQLWLPAPLASDSFNRANGAIGTTDGAGHAESTGLGAGGSGLAWTGATWTISTNAAINTPTAGADVIVNGAFAADTDWTKGTGWTIGGGVAVKAAGDLGTIYQAVLTSGVWYRSTYTLVRNAGTFRPRFGTALWGRAVTASATYMDTQRADGTSAGVQGADAASDGTIDDCSFVPLTLAELFSSLQASEEDVLAEAEVTLTSGTQAGVVVNLDSAVTPANFVIAYHDGTNCNLDKCVAGTYTSVISAAATYGAGAVLRVIKDGTSYSLFYNGSKVGSTSTISDAGIVSNTLHGLFSTYSGNSLDDFVVYARNGHSVPEG